VTPKSGKFCANALALVTDITAARAIAFGCKALRHFLLFMNSLLNELAKTFNQKTNTYYR
jgi:hypothetical protein